MAMRPGRGAAGIVALALVVVAGVVVAGVVGLRLAGPRWGERATAEPAAPAAAQPRESDAAGPPQTKARPQLLDPSPEQTRRTLATLRQVDDHPLFTMSYFGPAPRVDAGPAAGPATAGPARSTGMRKPFACTVFVAGGNRPLVGRNFDWDHNPALVLFANPTDAYRSVSVVDISYLGIGAASDLDDAAKREALLRAVTLPFDGMNEHGLTVGMAAVDDLRPELLPGRPAVGSVGVMRQVLDHARTIDEAIAVFRSYNIDFDGGPGLHYLVAEASGKSAVVEFIDGRLQIVPAQDRWQVMENFHLSTVADRSTFRRYSTANARLAATGGTLTPEDSMALLATVAQGHTQWSAVYDPVGLSLRLTTDQRYDTVHQFSALSS